MFEVIRKATGKRVKVYAVKGDRFLVDTGNGGFAYFPIGDFSPVTSEACVDATPCVFMPLSSESTDLEAALSRMFSGEATLGSTLSFRLLDGTEVDMVVTDMDGTTIRLESRDSLGMNTSANDLDGFLDRVYMQLPEVLRRRINEVERPHLDTDGKRYTTRRKLFVPAAPEIFPPEDCYGDKGLYEQLDWYKDVHNRVRATRKGGPSHWYWTSSPYGSTTSSFCGVGNNGGANGNNASHTYGVAPFGCIISKI